MLIVHTETILSELKHHKLELGAQVKSQLMAMRPSSSEARFWNAAGEKSRSFSAQVGHLSTTVTVTEFPLSTRSQFSDRRSNIMKPTMSDDGLAANLTKGLSALRMKQVRRGLTRAVFGLPGFGLPNESYTDEETATIKSLAKFVLPHAPRPGVKNVPSIMLVLNKRTYLKEIITHRIRREHTRQLR
jgi:hypothetical protein